MLPDMDLAKLSLEDRRRLVYYLEHHLINAISPLAACLDGDTGEASFRESAWYAKKRIIGLVNDVREVAGLRPTAERLLSLRASEAADAERRQLPLPLHPVGPPAEEPRLPGDADWRAGQISHTST
jgi:hypothetical protein